MQAFTAEQVAVAMVFCYVTKHSKAMTSICSPIHSLGEVQQGQLIPAPLGIT